MKSIINLHLISIILLGGCIFIDPLNYDPNQGVITGTIEQRNSWGEKHLGVSYLQIVDWVKNAQVINDKVGNIVSVAAFGKPNFISSSFTDGLAGNITLEIIGDKESAIFSAQNIQPCSEAKVCFRGGKLAIKTQEIAIHHSGVTIQNFKKPTNQIKYLSKQIQFLNRRLPNSKNDPFKSHFSTISLFTERAQMYAAIKEYQSALSDAEVALHLWKKQNPKPYKGRFTITKFQNYLKLLVLYNYSLGKYEESATAIKNIIKANSFLEHNDQDHDYLDLWLWIVRMKSGKKELAKQKLQNSLQLAIKDENKCSQKNTIARYLIDEITEKELLNYANKNPHNFVRNCRVPTSSAEFYNYYYIGQKEIILGDLEKGKKYLQNSAKDQKSPKIGEQTLEGWDLLNHLPD